jgi:hypothetical protein
MADFFQSEQQDPEAIRKAMLLKIFGIIPGMTGAAAPGAAPGAPATAAGTPPTTMTPAAGPAKPTAQPLATAAANKNGGAVEPGNQPAAPVLSEADWQKQNVPLAHKPYVEPDLKHRILEGLFAGMQEFGRPGEGARTVQNYTGEIERKTEAEKQWPATQEAQQHGRYETYLQGQKGPLDLADLNAQILDRQAQAKERAAKAEMELHPPAKLQHFVIDDPANPGQPKAVNFDQKTGAYIDPDTGKAIPGAKPWEKAEKVEPATIKYDNGIPVGVTAKGITYDIHDPNLPAELKPLVQSARAAHKQSLDEQMERENRAETRAEKARKEKEEQPTAQTKAMMEMVPKVKSLIGHMRQRIDEAENGTDPVIGPRWKEFMAGKVGWSDPAFTKLRTDAGLLQTALMRMHVGARGGELMMQHFKDLFDVGKQHPDNLKAALDEIEQYANDVAGEGKKGNESPAAPKPGALPPGWKR